VRNLTAGSATVRPAVQAGGRFAADVPITTAGARETDETVANTIEVRLTAFAGTALEQTVTETRTVRAIDQATFEALATDGIVEATSSREPESAHGNGKKPDGGPLPNHLLHDFLMSEFADAVELYGAETFEVHDPLGGASGAPVELRVDFVYRHGCFKSDVGWFAYDPARPPANAAAALENATVLFNSGAIGEVSCSEKSIPHGAEGSHATITLPPGSALGFFLIPNRTLAQWKKKPKAGRDPLFTLSKLNACGGDPVLAFRSARGRTLAGTEEVVNAGPLILLAWEESSLNGNGVDQDYNDVLFTVSAGIAGAVPAPECD
jgi:hypothetical protein